MRRFILGIVLLAVTALAFGQQVVASTSWTAAFALAAGAEDVAVLAPYDLTHPPEYELRPTDIRTIMNADLVVYAGYENMVERLLDAAGDADAEALQIMTVHSMQAMTASITAIAEEIDTEERAARNLDSIRTFIADWSQEVAGYGLDEAPVLVHFHQRALAEGLGMNVVGVFGPAPLEARQIDELTKTSPTLIIDNGHNPVAQPVAETTSAPVSVWYNFPGVDGSRTLLDIFEMNRAALDATLD
ncbi:MAG: metal ABC transporter solute-binding protein, Zn/Mn family [Spirochaetota bacterium]